jgi:hypothetical protein
MSQTSEPKSLPEGFSLEDSGIHATPGTLKTLWEKDPANLQDFEMEAIVNELRRGRQQWAQEDSSAKTTSRRVKPSKGQNLKLEDLGIERSSLEDLFSDDGGSK